MKSSVLVKRLSGAINESILYQNPFVCLASVVNNKKQENNCVTTKVQKITFINSKNLQNLLLEGLQKNSTLKCFSSEESYISFLYGKKDNNICFSLIKYKSYFIEKPNKNFNSWILNNNITQKASLSATKYIFAAAILPVLLKNFENDNKIVE